MNRLSAAKQTAVVGALVEGCSIRATVRLTGVAKNTVTKLLVDLGAACTKYQDETLRDLRCRRLQCDEIWSFVGAKDKNIPAGQEKFGTRLGLDLDGYRRGYQTRPILARGNSGCGLSLRVHDRRGEPPASPSSTND